MDLVKIAGFLAVFSSALILFGRLRHTPLRRFTIIDFGLVLAFAIGAGLFLNR